MNPLAALCERRNKFLKYTCIMRKPVGLVGAIHFAKWTLDYSG